MRSFEQATVIMIGLMMNAIKNTTKLEVKTSKKSRNCGKDCIFCLTSEKLGKTE
jgi:hypothetical protein